MLSVASTPARLREAAPRAVHPPARGRDGNHGPRPRPGPRLEANRLVWVCGVPGGGPSPLSLWDPRLKLLGLALTESASRSQSEAQRSVLQRTAPRWDSAQWGPLQAGRALADF